jgi:hypothetical protein
MICTLTQFPVKIQVPYPAEFITKPREQKTVREVIAANYPDPASLPSIPERGNILLHAVIPRKAAAPHHPPYIGMRFDNVLSPSVQAYLLKLYKLLCDVRLPHLLKTKTKRASDGSEAWHLAIWSVYSTKPRFSSESCPKNPAVAKAVDQFLRAVKLHVAPVINSILQTYAPKTWRRHRR